MLAFSFLHFYLLFPRLRHLVLIILNTFSDLISLYVTNFPWLLLAMQTLPSRYLSSDTLLGHVSQAPASFIGCCPLWMPLSPDLDWHEMSGCPLHLPCCAQVLTSYTIKDALLILPMVWYPLLPWPWTPMSRFPLYFTWAPNWAALLCQHLPYPLGIHALFCVTVSLALVYLCCTAHPNGFQTKLFRKRSGENKGKDERKLKFPFKNRDKPSAEKIVSHWNLLQHFYLKPQGNMTIKKTKQMSMRKWINMFQHTFSYSSLGVNS